MRLTGRLGRLAPVLALIVAAVHCCGTDEAGARVTAYPVAGLDQRTPTAPAAQPAAPVQIELGWMLTSSGSMHCTIWVNHLVCDKLLPDIQPPQIEAFGAVEPWLPRECSQFTFKPGNNAGKPAEITLYGQPGGRGCVPGDPESTDRGFCMLRVAPTGVWGCEYEGANLNHLPGVVMEAVDVHGHPEVGWSWGTRIYVP